MSKRTKTSRIKEPVEKKESIEHQEQVTADGGGNETIGAFPNEGERPCYRVYTHPVMNNGKIQREGGYSHYNVEDKLSKKLIPVDEWLCSPIEVVANTQDEGKNAGRLVMVHRTDEPTNECITLRLEDITARGYDSPAIKSLSRRSVMINDNAKRSILRFLGRPAKKMVYVRQRTGWADDTPDDMPVFLLPDETMGSEDYFVDIGDDPYKSKGTLDDWKNTIGKYALNNPVVQLGLMCGFSGVLLKACGLTGGGLHVWGENGRGKSSILQASTSIWGHGRDFAHKWDATTNGLEALALSRNDTLMALDELQDLDVRTADKMVYALANGQARVRAKGVNGDVTINVKKPWRVMTLSTGEKSIKDFIRQASGQQKGGQGVRFLDIQVDTQEYGTFTSLNGFNSPHELAEAIALDSTRYYGTAGKAFISHVVTLTVNDIRQRFNEARKRVTNTQISTEEARALKIFALLLVAGEIAIEASILPWGINEPLNAIKKAFELWRRGRGISGENIALMFTLKGFRDKTLHRKALFIDNDKKPDNAMIPIGSI